MNSKEIKSSLIAKFNEPLKISEVRKIVFWIDTEKTFTDVYSDIEINGVKKHHLLENNYFYTKYLLEEEDTESNYLIYTNESLGVNIENWLAGCFLYSEAFYADVVSLILDDFGIPKNMRHIIQSHSKFFNSKDRYNGLKRLYIEEYDEIPLYKAMICVVCKIKKYSIDDAIRKLIIENISNEDTLNDIYNFVGEKEFWQVIENEYGYKLEDHNIRKLAIHLMITAMSFSVSENLINKYDIYNSKIRKNACVFFVDRWLSDDMQQFEIVVKVIESEIMLLSHLKEFSIEEVANIGVFPSIDRLIILYIAGALKEDRSDYELFLELVDKRKSLAFYINYEHIYSCLYYLISMLIFKRENQGLLCKSHANTLLERYTSIFYKMDFYYRKFYINYDNDNSSDVVKDLRELAEDIYSNWYLSKLSFEFSDAIEHESNIYSLNGTYQNEFYKKYINNHVKNNEKVFVIISDALRYEVGVELNEKILAENKGQTKIDFMLSSLPSITKFGMAALLPHKEISYNGTDIFVDNKPCKSTKDRERILQENCDESVIFTLHDLNNMARSELEKCTVGKKLIYVYHNSIDALGDKSSTEMQAFEGCEKAVNEISSLVKIIKDRMNGTNIYITSDHGFIYTRDKIIELDKTMKITDYEEIGRRYAISKDNNSSSELLLTDLKISGNQNLYVLSPKDNKRFKIQGGGNNFVHGGASLHEMVVPVIAYKNKRTNQKGAIEAQKTTINLTTASRIITNSVFTLNFYQTKPIGDKVLPINTKIYLANKNNEVISNEVTVIGDVKSTDPKERSFSRRFTLKPMEYSRNDKYILKIKDEETGLDIENIIFNINIAISNDFDI